MSLPGCGSKVSRFPGGRLRQKRGKLALGYPTRILVCRPRRTVKDSLNIPSISGGCLTFVLKRNFSVTMKKRSALRYEFR